ncbi:hypothetical protein RRG08_042308 [Elysia crispata]|uniref:Uncharacterized protein n=1 Tax=Elysia crispata TaxID=231223 RepID=A0AAE0ZWG5_9GAST|nr:hypothetical protein RRG08_042308 [Elysia crispata]
MVWSTVFSLLILFMRQCSAAFLSPNSFRYSSTCSDQYLVEHDDFIVLYVVAIQPTSTHPFQNACKGPHFFCSRKTRNNTLLIPVGVCTTFDLGTDQCTDRGGEPNSCSSKIKFLGFQSSSSNDFEDFSVAEKDTTVIQFLVSGNNSVHSFNGINGPQFYFTTKDNVSVKGCLGFDNDTGSCTNRPGVRDACSCEMLTSTVYLLSYTITASHNTSGATVYLLWPGKPDLRSGNYTLPELRAVRGSGYNVHTSLSIGVGLVFLLATVAGVGVMYHSQNGDTENKNIPALLGSGFSRVDFGHTTTGTNLFLKTFRTELQESCGLCHCATGLSSKNHVAGVTVLQD